MHLPEIQGLERARQRPGPRLISVEGRPGDWGFERVIASSQEARIAVFVPPGTSDHANRNALVNAAADATRSTASDWLPSDSPPPAWPDLLSALASTSPLTVVVRETRNLVAVNKKFWRDFGLGWQEIRASGQRIHFIFVEDEKGLGADLNRADSPLRDPATRLLPRPGPDPVEVLAAQPGSIYDVARRYPDLTGYDLLVGYALAGGLPETWAWFGERSPSQHSLRQVLEADGSPVLEAPWRTLERKLQLPARYASILSLVANGAEARRELRAGDSTFGSETLGPYLQRLRSLGLLDAYRPLDTDPKGRRTRYGISDPFELLWWRLIHPIRARLLRAELRGLVWNEVIEPALNEHVRRVFPRVCLQFLQEGASSILGAVARRAGRLWGQGYDFPVAATLENGAVCYGAVHTAPGPAPIECLHTLQNEVGETRYGFGRQARIRLIFSLSGFEDALVRAAARDPMVRLLGVREMIGARPEPDAQ